MNWDQLSLGLMSIAILCVVTYYLLQIIPVTVIALLGILAIIGFASKEYTKNFFE